MLQSTGSLKPLTKGSTMAASKFRGSVRAYTSSLPVPQNALAGPATQDVQNPEAEITHQKQGPGSSMNQNAVSVFTEGSWSPIPIILRERSAHQIKQFASAREFPYFEVTAG